MLSRLYAAACTPGGGKPGTGLMPPLKLTGSLAVEKSTGSVCSSIGLGAVNAGPTGTGTPSLCVVEYCGLGAPLRIKLPFKNLNFVLYLFTREKDLSFNIYYCLEGWAT